MPETPNSATLNAKGQVTLPIAVRTALDVGPGDKVVFTIHQGGRVEVAKTPESTYDLALEAYLAFLERDMRKRPHAISVLKRDDAIRRLISEAETEEFDLS